jgi:hypothetical protein
MPRSAEQPALLRMCLGTSAEGGAKKRGGPQNVPTERHDAGVLRRYGRSAEQPALLRSAFCVPRRGPAQQVSCAASGPRPTRLQPPPGPAC